MSPFAVIIPCVATIVCAIGWRRAVVARRRRQAERDDEAWMHASCLSIAEGQPCVAEDAAVKASLATRTVFSLRKAYEASIAETKVAREDADRLAVCVHDYIKQMDGFSMKLGDQPCALSRERSALSQHQKLKESQPCPPNQS